MVVPQLKGNDFWSMVDKWFTARMQPDQLGNSWTTPAWTKYVYLISITSLLLTCYEHRFIEETLEQDRARFKTVLNVNPFLTDFMAEETGGTGGDDVGDAVVSAIGSMQGILGAL
jgi:hypothetical protein